MTEVVVNSETQGEAAVEAAPRPDNVPEKFWNAEAGQINTDALLQSYSHLEGKQSATPAQPTDSLSIPAAPAQSTADVLESVVASYRENNTFSEADLSSIAASGLTRGMVETHMQAQAAIAASNTQAAYAAAGDKTQYDAVTSWAGSNLSPAEIAAFDSIVNSGDVNGVALAVGGLKARYTAANGSEGARIDAGNPVANGEMYEYRADMVAATKTELYKTSQKERDRVRDIVERSMDKW